MYRKDSVRWLKHIDFILLDMICLQVAFILAFLIRKHEWNPYADPLYLNMAMFLEAADLIVLFSYGTVRNVLKRGHWQNFLRTLVHCLIVLGLSALYLFIIQKGYEFSRIILVLTTAFYFAITYVVRELWKKFLRKKMVRGGGHRLLIITSKDVAEQVVADIKKHNYAKYTFVGVAVVDADWTGGTVNDLPVVANGETVTKYVCQEWVDEVLIVLSEDLPYPSKLIEQLTVIGVVVHQNLAHIENVSGKKQFVEKVGNYTVLTTSVNYASYTSLLLKRLLDILGGLVGCILTGIIFLFVAPAIYIASPGPIFFAQERVGKNGKPFKIYKFRSMYMDAEERKAELMKDNKLGDGKMFKLDFDPRVIGNKVLPDGTQKTGVGDFIRRTSLDEFPQFFNVLKGEMSLVGTRPPLPSETELYDLHHNARLAVKPGITGLWQISGRSDIIDFEEVVRLDRQYIENWNLGMDIKILLKTVVVVFKKSGSV